VIKNLVRAWCPPILWGVLRKIKGSVEPSGYQGVFTQHSMTTLHNSKLVRERAKHLPPNQDAAITMLRHLEVYRAALSAQYIDGDFVTAGISYCVAPLTIFNLLKPKKTWHLIDPFEGTDENGNVNPDYNRDANFVKRQFPKGAKVKFHTGYIPDCLKDSGIGKLSLVHLNTGNAKAEAKSLPYFYERLSTGGIMVIDCYAYGKGHEDVFDPVIKNLGAEIINLVTGQGVIVKSAKP
jgi:hypothetical protein